MKDARGMGGKKIAPEERRERLSGHGEDMEDFPQEIECKTKGGGVKNNQYDGLIAQM